MEALFEGQILTSNVFRVAGIVAIDESRSMVYAGSMKDLAGQFGEKVALVYEVRVKEE
jgi:hypothetical protein